MFRYFGIFRVLRNWGLGCVAFAGCCTACSGRVVGAGGATGMVTGTSGHGSIGTGGTSPGGGTAIGGSASGGDTGTTGGVVLLTPAAVDGLQSAACAGWTISTKITPANLDLVVDVSGSMASPAPGGGTRWEVTRNALATAIDSLPDGTGVGLLLFPNLANVSVSTTVRDVSACVNVSAMVGVEPLDSAQRSRLDAALVTATVAGGTPTHDAYRYGLTQGLIPASLGGNDFMLLITDGQPTYALNCVGDGLDIHAVDAQPLIDEIAGASSIGISTFVIGVPGSEQDMATGADARPWLSSAARAGGTGPAGCQDIGLNFCHVDLTQAPDFAAALDAALKQIASQITSCTYPLPAPPNGATLDPSLLNVLYRDRSGQTWLLQRSSDPQCSQGYQLVSGDTITLCPDTCARVRADGAQELELLGGCPSIGGAP